MRKIGGHVSIAGGLPNAVKRTLEIGGNCMQIFAGSPRLWLRRPFPTDQVTAFLTATKENQLGPTFIHALYLVNLASSNPDILEKSFNSLVADMQNGHLIGSSGVIVHIGSHLGAGFDSVREQVVSVTRRLLSATQGCDLVLENDAGQNGKIGSLEELSFIIKTVDSPRLKVCLDTAHLFESGVDLRKKESVNSLVSALQKLGLHDRLVCLHLNDSATLFDSHRDVHANLGEGEIGLEGLGNIANHPAFSSLPAILEVPGKDRSGCGPEDIKTAREILH